MHYEFESKVIPIKFQQLFLPLPRINNKEKGISKDKSLCDKV